MIVCTYLPAIHIDGDVTVIFFALLMALLCSIENPKTFCASRRVTRTTNIMIVYFQVTDNSPSTSAAPRGRGLLRTLFPEFPTRMFSSGVNTSCFFFASFPYSRM